MKKILLVALGLFALNATAVDINCKGKITWVMDYPSKCNGNTAFKTSTSNGKWICPPSDKGNSIVLAALAADKEVEVYIDSQDGTYTCGTLSHYINARYIIINP